MTSLFGLVAGAARRYLNVEEEIGWPPCLLPQAVLRLVFQGDFSGAYRLVRQFEWFRGHPPAFEPEFQGRMLRLGVAPPEAPEEAYWAYPSWPPFARTCDLADRIDHLLVRLEGRGRVATLAWGCREDLDGLLILADWCEENNLPPFASEARHLHSLAQSVQNDPGFHAYFPAPETLPAWEQFEADVE
jgi:hypothetical protein